mmetsp:Transcript_29967/g.75414  ORF Transcript_29967/g.75414 Transcript_29967/m.75414 type:complete len:302 (+) Transcript_29967:1590-2495(+)
MNLTLPSMRWRSFHSFSIHSSGSSASSSLVFSTTVFFSNSSWQRFSNSRVKLTLSCFGTCCESTKQRRAYIELKLGCVSATENTFAITPRRMPLEVVSLTSFTERRSKFSSESLLSSSNTLRSTSASRSSSVLADWLGRFQPFSLTCSGSTGGRSSSYWPPEPRMPPRFDEWERPVRLEPLRELLIRPLCMLDCEAVRPPRCAAKPGGANELLPPKPGGAKPPRREFALRQSGPLLKEPRPPRCCEKPPEWLSSPERDLLPPEPCPVFTSITSTESSRGLLLQCGWNCRRKSREYTRRSAG